MLHAVKRSGYQSPPCWCGCTAAAQPQWPRTSAERGSAHGLSCRALPAAGLYCATRPTIQDCSSVRFSCWMGAYPTLSGHFAAANLDPQSNMWDKVRPADGLLEPLQPQTEWGSIHTSREPLRRQTEWGSIHMLKESLTWQTEWSSTHIKWGFSSAWEATWSPAVRGCVKHSPGAAACCLVQGDIMRQQHTCPKASARHCEA